MAEISQALPDVDSAFRQVLAQRASYGAELAGVLDLEVYDGGYRDGDLSSKAIVHEFRTLTTS